MDESPAARIRAANAAILADRDADAVGEYFAPDFVAHLTEGAMNGHAAVRRYVGGLLRAFPDLAVEVEVLVEAGDRVAWQRTMRGTHRGEFRGFPPSGRSIVWRDMVISRLQDGLIAEDWAISDLAERLLLAQEG